MNVLEAASRRALRPARKIYRAAASECARVVLPKLNFNTRVLVNGKRFVVPIHRAIGLRNRKDAEPWMTDLLTRLLSLTGSTGLIDVGVNVGQTLLKLKSIDPDLRYIGFEPNPVCVSLVHELIRLNGLSAAELAPVALADSPALLTLSEEVEGDCGASVVADLRPGRALFQKQLIAALVFDDLSLDTEGIRVVKIDVEGAESHVLSGMRKFLRDRRPVVICEVLDADSRADLAANVARNNTTGDLLAELDYRIFWLRKGRSRVESLQPIAAFPERVFDDDSWDNCDYLLVPVELAEEAGNTFGVANPSQP